MGFPEGDGARRPATGLLGPGLRAARRAQDAEAAANRAGQPHGYGRLGQRGAQLEARVVGQQRAGDDARARRGASAQHHAGADAHQRRRTAPQDGPTALRHLRSHSLGVNLREQDQLLRIGGVDGQALGGEQGGVGAAQGRSVLTCGPAAGDAWGTPWRPASTAQPARPGRHHGCGPRRAAPPCGGPATRV